jgi:hypothetical protein
MVYVRTKLLSIEFPESDEAVPAETDRPQRQLAVHGSYWHDDHD